MLLVGFKARPHEETRGLAVVTGHGLSLRAWPLSPQKADGLIRGFSQVTRHARDEATPSENESLGIWQFQGRCTVAVAWSVGSFAEKLLSNWQAHFLPNKVMTSSSPGDFFCNLEIPHQIQGGPSASGKIYVDIKFKVPSPALVTG